MVGLGCRNSSGLDSVEVKWIDGTDPGVCILLTVCA
jgi:hypothetical protein